MQWCTNNRWANICIGRRKQEHEELATILFLLIENDTGLVHAAELNTKLPELISRLRQFEP